MSESLQRRFRGTKRLCAHKQSGRMLVVADAGAKPSSPLDPVMSQRSHLTTFDWHVMTGDEMDMNFANLTVSALESGG